jgi:hypothetical protein
LYLDSSQKEPAGNEYLKAIAEAKKLDGLPTEYVFDDRDVILYSKCPHRPKTIFTDNNKI